MAKVVHVTCLFLLMMVLLNKISHIRVKAMRPDSLTRREQTEDACSSIPLLYQGSSIEEEMDTFPLFSFAFSPLSLSGRATP